MQIHGRLQQSRADVTAVGGAKAVNQPIVIRVPTQMALANFRTFQHHKHQTRSPTVLPLTTFYVVLIRKHGAENVIGNFFADLL